MDVNFQLESFYKDDSLLPAFDPYMGNQFNAFDIRNFSNLANLDSDDFYTMDPVR